MLFVILISQLLLIMAVHIMLFGFWNISHVMVMVMIHCYDLFY